MAESGTIQTPEYLSCPNCDEDLPIEMLMDICADPINGIIDNCPGCDHELELNMGIRVIDLTEEGA